MTISVLIKGIDGDDWKKAKSKAALEGVTMKQKIGELIKQYVKGSSKR